MSWHPKVLSGKGQQMIEYLRRKSSWSGLFVLLLLPLSIPVPAETTTGTPSDLTPAQMQSGSLLLRMQSGYISAARMNTEIDANISGLVARVSVKQTFRNDGPEWVEGVYVYPLPDGAAVDRLKMHIGERIIEGEIREKAEAKKEYEAAKVAGKKSSLVEQQRANLFTTSIANIGPGETVVVEVEYLETLRYDEGTFSLRFPLTLTPRYIPGIPTPDRQGSGWSADTDRVSDASMITPPVVGSSQDHKVSFHADLNAGVALDVIASRYHPVDIRDVGNRYEIELLGKDVPMDHDIELTWRPAAATAPRAAVFSESIDGQPHLLLMLLPPNDVSAPITRMPRETIFVIDTSGSMHGTSLSQAKRALTLALDGLHSVDRFNVIQFNSVTSALFADSKSATANNIDMAKRYVAGLSATGGTEMRPAIEQALNTTATELQTESHLRQIVFITDGSVGNEVELFKLIEERLGRSRLFTVGIGSAPNSWFMRKAAEAGHGTYTFISALHEVKEKMSSLFRKLEQPQITDIAIEWPSDVEFASYPQTVPDLYAGEPVIVKSRLESEPQSGDQVRVSGNSVLGAWAEVLPVHFKQNSPGVATLWARARIEDLFDQERRGADSAEIRQAVIETAISHHLVSKYTSLVAVDKTPVRPQSESLSREQVANLLPYGQSQQAIFGFPATATGVGVYWIKSALLFTAAFLLMLFMFFATGHVARGTPALESGH